MRLFLHWLWYIFIAVSILCIFSVDLRTSSVSHYFLLALGLLFYALKLYYVNGVSPLAINYLTIVFDLLLYLYCLIIGVAVWWCIYLLWNYIDPGHFRRYFPTDPVFYLVARRMIFIGANLCMLALLTSGVNKPYRVLRFTNKVAVVEVVLLAVAVCWLVVDRAYVSFFAIIVIYNTMPDEPKILLSRLLSWSTKTQVDLLNVPIQNNSLFPPMDRLGYLLNAICLVLIPIHIGVKAQVPLAAAALLIILAIGTAVGLG